VTARIEGRALEAAEARAQTIGTGTAPKKKFEIHSPRFDTKSSISTSTISYTGSMSKRPADSDEHELDAIKNGDRPMELDQEEAGEFEDEFEDEYESEDEIFEAGVDGRPDEEREAEERESRFHHVCWDQTPSNLGQMPWMSTRAHSYPAATSSPPARPLRPIFPPTKCSTHSKHPGRACHAT